jgi:hypothetical protein
MPDRLVFDDDAAEDLQESLRAIVLDRQSALARIHLSTAAAASAFEHFREALQHANDVINDDIDALDAYLSAAVSELSSVDRKLASDLRQPGQSQ